MQLNKVLTRVRSFALCFLHPIKSRKTTFSVIPANPGSSPVQAPESSILKSLRIFWTPVTLSRRKPGTGVTTFYESVSLKHSIKIRAKMQGEVTDRAAE
jgi:hypothetical protein